MEEDVRARRSECDQRQATGDRQSPPRAPGGDGQRYEQQDARVLRTRREADGEARELDSARDHERERDGDSEGQRHVRDRHPRVGDVRRLYGRRSGGDEAGRQPVGALSQPPRRRDRAHREHDHRQARREVRRLVLPRLKRRQQVQDEAREVEAVRVEAPAVNHRPGSRDDVLLVGVQERKREPVLDPGEAQCAGERQDGGERNRRASPPALGSLRPLAGRHEPAQRCC